MMIVYILCGSILYFLIAGLVSGLLNSVIPIDEFDDDDDATWFPIVLGIFWPLVFPLYLLYLAYKKGWSLMESFLNKKSEIDRKP